MLVVAAFLLVARLAGAAREMAVAARYGAGAEVDAFTLVFNIVSWPAGVWGSAVTAVLLPILVRETAGSRDLTRLRREMLGAAIVVGGACALVCLALVELSPSSGLFGLAPSSAAVAEKITPLLCLVAPLMMMLVVFSTFLMASQRQTSTLLEGIVPLVACAAILLVPGGGILPLIWGVLAGLAVQIFLSACVQPRPAVFLPAFSLKAPQWRTFSKAALFVVLGGALMSVTATVDQLMVIKLGVSANAFLGYATRLLALGISIGTVIFSRAMLPVMSRFAETEPSRARRMTRQWSGLLMMGGVLAVAVAWPLTPWAVRIIFERGAFTAADTDVVAGLVRVGMLQLPFLLAGMPLAQFMASSSKHWMFLIVGVVALSTKLLLNVVLIEPLGIQGVMWASAGMYAATAVTMHIALARHARRSRT